MSPWWIFGLAVLLGAAGWRYIGRFYQRWLFPATALLPGATAIPGGRVAATNVASQIALLLGGGVFISVPLASFWGWGPVLLWLLVGGFGVCGLIAAGLHFLDARYPLDGFSVVSKDLLGQHGSRSLALLVQIAATLIHSLLLVVASQLMALFPVAASLVLLHWLPLLCLKKTRRWPSGIHAVMTLAVLWLLALPIAGLVPLRLAGEIQLLGGGESQFTLQASNLWLLILVALNVYLLHRADPAMTVYRLGAGVCCALLLMLGLFGLLSYPAVLVIPRIAATAPAPLLPGFLLTMPAVTLSVWYMISIAGSHRSQQRMSPIQSYTGIIVVVLAALVLLLLIASGNEQTRPLVWQSQQSLQFTFSAALVRVAGLLGQLGIPADLSLGFTGFTVIIILMAALQAGLRGQCVLFNDSIKETGLSRIRVATLPLLTFTAALALFILPGPGLAPIWGAWGIASALASAGLLVMTGLALMRQQRAGGLALILGAVLWGVGQWADLLSLLQHNGNFQPFDLLYGLLFLLGCWLLVPVIKSWRTLRLAAQRTPGKINLLLR